MGYCTRYDLSIEPADDDYFKNHTEEIKADKLVIEHLKLINPDYFGFSDDWICPNDYLIDEMKWYEHENDMIQLSKELPQYIFILHGEGEESDDMWDKYFFNGKMDTCYAEIIFPKPKWYKEKRGYK